MATSTWHFALAFEQTILRKAAPMKSRQSRLPKPSNVGAQESTRSRLTIYPTQSGDWTEEVAGCICIQYHGSTRDLAIPFAQLTFSRSLELEDSHNIHR